MLHTFEAHTGILAKGMELDETGDSIVLQGRTPCKVNLSRDNRRPRTDGLTVVHAKIDESNRLVRDERGDEIIGHILITGGRAQCSPPPIRTIGNTDSDKIIVVRPGTIVNVKNGTSSATLEFDRSGQLTVEKFSAKAPAIA